MQELLLKVQTVTSAGFGLHTQMPQKILIRHRNAVQIVTFWKCLQMLPPRLVAALNVVRELMWSTCKTSLLSRLWFSVCWCPWDVLRVRSDSSLCLTKFLGGGSYSVATEFHKVQVAECFFSFSSCFCFACWSSYWTHSAKIITSLSLTFTGDDTTDTIFIATPCHQPFQYITDEVILYNLSTSSPWSTWKVLTLLSILPAPLNPKSMATLFSSFGVSVGANQQLPTSSFCCPADQHKSQC